jgi:hypothetical protein
MLKVEIRNMGPYGSIDPLPRWKSEESEQGYETGGSIDFEET